MRAVALGALVAVALTVVTCGDPPAQPTNDLSPDFIITRGMNVLPVGGDTSFGATAYTRSRVPNAALPGRHQITDISEAVRWSSDNTAVAFRRSGVLVGRSAGHANVTASYMGRSHTLPVDVISRTDLVQQFAGTWSGFANVYCGDLRGSTRCDFVIAYFEGLLGKIGVTLSLTAVDGVLQGVIDFGGGSWSPRSGAVVGGITGDGALVIGGEEMLRDAESGPGQLRDWRLTRVGNTLTGSGAIDRAWINIYGPVWNREYFKDIRLQ